MINVEAYLQQQGITYVLHEHPAVFTTAEAEEHCANVPGMPGKNLFLRNRKRTRYFLAVLPAIKRMDLKQFAKLVGEPDVTFGKPDVLKEKLGLEPGSVSPFGLLNNTAGDVELFIDKDIFDADIVNFHPNRNTASLELTKEMFHKYLSSVSHETRTITL